jgi:beta-galactosidase beta subunit
MQCPICLKPAHRLEGFDTSVETQGREVYLIPVQMWTCKVEGQITTYHNFYIEIDD